MHSLKPVPARFVKRCSRAALCALAAVVICACSKRAETPAPSSSQASSPSSTPAETARAANAPASDASPAPELITDARLAQAVRDFQSTPDPAERSMRTNDFIELATGGVPSHEVAHALGSLLKSEPETKVRLDILDHLVILDDPDMIFQVAVGLAPDQPKQVRATAIELLENYGDKRIAPILSQTASSDPDPAIRDSAASAAKSLNEASAAATPD
jgi:hypothetical protein